MNVVAALMGLLQAVAPAVSGSGAVGKIVTTLTQLVPVLVDQYQDVLPSVKNIIESLRTHDDITDEQWDELDKIEQAIDDEFEKAVKAAEEEDK